MVLRKEGLVWINPREGVPKAMVSDEAPVLPLPSHLLPWELRETGGFLFCHENRDDVDIRGERDS